MPKTNIFEFVERMAALIRSEERKRCTELRLQLVHFEVLNYLSQANQYTDTPAATAAYFGMTRGTVSQSLIILEKKGYLEKSKDDTDKRIVHVRILPPGVALIKKASIVELYNKATSILILTTPAPTPTHQFIKVLSALQKAAGSQSFNSTQNLNKHMTKKLSVFELIDMMATVIRSEERKKCTELKLQMTHFQVLEYLSTCNKYSDTPAAIANYFGMTRGTVSQTLILLEKKALIKKTQDINDKRVYHIQLLPAGLNLYQKAKPSALFNKACEILDQDSSITGQDEEIFIQTLTALQKANNSYSFGVCKTCHNFSKKASDFYCKLTQETLSKEDSEKICQEHVPV